MNKCYPKSTLKRSPEAQAREAEYQKNKKEICDEMLREHGYLFCQKTGKNFASYSCHHIVFRSEKPKHEFLHDKRNLILIGDPIHDDAHKHKHTWRAELVEKRGLIELFGNDIVKYNQL